MSCYNLIREFTNTLSRTTYAEHRSCRHVSNCDPCKVHRILEGFIWGGGGGGILQSFEVIKLEY